MAGDDKDDCGDRSAELLKSRAEAYGADGGEGCLEGRADGHGIDDVLGRSLAGPTADEEYQSELRRRLMSLHPASRESRTIIVRSRAMERRERAERKIDMRVMWKYGLVVVAIALVAGLGLALVSSLVGREPVAEFGTLPPLASGAPASQGAAGGPGYTFDFEYSLGGSLASGLPGFAKRETVYKFVPFDFTEGHVRALAQGLGLEGTIEKQAFQDGYTLSTGTQDGTRYIMAFQDGYVIYNENYDYSPVDRSALPTEARAIELARGWLESHGFVPPRENGEACGSGADSGAAASGGSGGTTASGGSGAVSGPCALGQAEVTEELEQGSLLVQFRPAEPADIVTAGPYAAVRIGAGEKVVMGQSTWYPEAARSPYPLRPALDAWEAVRAGQGILKVDFNKYGPFGNEMEVNGPAIIDKVRLGWALTMGADKTPYLVPVYVFSGVARHPTDKGAPDFPIEIYAPAVEDEYMGK